MYCLLYILKNAIYKRKLRITPDAKREDLEDSPENAMKPIEQINNAKLELLLNNLHDFKMLSADEIDLINQFTSDEKIRIILTYNTIMETIQIMFEYK